MARRSSEKRYRDPKAPRRGRSAWQMFYVDNREEVKKQNPDLNSREITKKLGDMWREVDDGTKRRYQKQYQSSQAEYDEKVAAYKDEKKKKRQASSSKKNTGQTNKGNNNDNNNDETNEDNNNQS